ncbi:MAG TPA: MetQ/NlpA family ABC transporter substrate-binding protein [Ruminiclostridium sp.]|nr:MetQ/NlpA family ABC transporter substrate-binding protein [Ruminiclostridium sp.]
MKKRFLALAMALTFTLAGVLSGCGSQTKKLVVGATPSPHAEILKEVQSVLKEKGIDLEIKEFTDYVQPNLALQDKNLDANYFQHQPYLDDFNAKNKTDLVAAAQIHYEPLGLYPGKVKSLDALTDGATIAVPNDTTNEARALLLLETIGLIKVNPDAGLKATVKDITENPKNIKIKELEAAQLTRSLSDVDMAVINGNYAIEAGFNVAKDALAKEEADSVAAKTFANIIAVRKGDENREDIKALIEALKSDKVKKFIEEKYKGAVVAIF